MRYQLLPAQVRGLAAVRRRALAGCAALLCVGAAAFPASALAGAGTARVEAPGADQPAHPRRKVIVDDDGFALMELMVLGDPDVDVLGFTSVTGGSWANRVTAQMLKGLETAHRTDVPVHQGATFPLVNSEALTDRWEALYGKLTWKGAWMKAWVEPTLQSTPPYHRPDDPVDLPGGNPVTRPADEDAARFMIRMVHRYPGEVTILAAGPMTNVALAQRLDPEFAGLAKELVYMGGSFNPHQVIRNQSADEFAREFANSPRREFNTRFDPEAASIVSRGNWRAITAIPVDPSTSTQITDKLKERLKSARRRRRGRLHPRLGKRLSSVGRDRRRGLA